MTDWFRKLQKAKKTCIRDGQFLKVHYEFDDGKEMVEEYNTKTTVLNQRAWKIKKEIGGEGEWSVEIGEIIPSYSSTSPMDTIKENPNSPFVTRAISKEYYEWRIRNLPYPIDNYRIQPDDKFIVVRTLNKKYFKRLDVPELERVGLKPQQDQIQFSHKYNTLVILYRKPHEVIKQEKEVYEMIKNVKCQESANDKLHSMLNYINEIKSK